MRRILFEFPPGDQAALSLVFEGLCPLPQPFASHEQWLRFNHLDLAGLSTAEIVLELNRACVRAALEENPHPWFAERRHRLEEIVRHGD